MFSSIIRLVELILDSVKIPPRHLSIYYYIPSYLKSNILNYKKKAEHILSNVY